jgi:hypothetical protein
MRVCAHLGIPFMTLDLEKEYKEGVVDYLVREYEAGRTPNPDVMEYLLLPTLLLSRLLLSTPMSIPSSRGR